MNAEQKLANLWAEDRPPERDPAFTIAVLGRMERRRLWDELADLVPLVVVIGVLAWALAPTAETMLNGDLAGMGATAFVLAASVLGGIWLAIAAQRSILPGQGLFGNDR